MSTWVLHLNKTASKVVKLLNCYVVRHLVSIENWQGLAAFLKAIGYLIPLMDNVSANYYTKEVMLILIREFQSPDEEMKKIVLKVGPLRSSW